MRSGVLSAPETIELVSSRFVPYALNVTTDGFERCTAELPALRHLQRLYTTNWRFAYGFASCVALTSDGQHPLAWSSAGSAKELSVFLAFLATAQQRAERVAQLQRAAAAGQWQTALQQLGALFGEIVADITAKMAQVRQGPQ